MATRPKPNDEQDARTDENQQQKGAEQDPAPSATKDPNHKYSYGGFREDLLYKGSEDREGKADEGKDG